MFISYDRITDTMMYLSSDVSLNFVVTLSKKRKDGSRSWFHSEFEKQSKYVGTTIPSVTIRRSFSYYFVLDIKNMFGSGFLFKPADVIMFEELINTKIFPWFKGDSKVFAIVDNKMVVNGIYEPVVYTRSEYEYLMFAPIVFEYENGQFKEGVRMFINTKEYFVDMTIDTLYGFIYMLTRTDMYNLASSMVNYVKTAPYRENLRTMEGLGSGGIDNGFEDAPEIPSPGSAKSFLEKTKRK